MFDRGKSPVFNPECNEFQDGESLHQLAEYFVFDKQKYTLEEFFGDIKLFKDQFKQVFFSSSAS